MDSYRITNTVYGATLIILQVTYSETYLAPLFN